MLTWLMVLYTFLFVSKCDNDNDTDDWETGTLVDFKDGKFGFVA